jgi:hypothetical protein
LVTGFPGFLYRVLGVRQCRLIAVSSSLVFLLIYALAVGMIFILPSPLPETIRTPLVQLILEGPLGQVPWLVIYLNRYWVLSVSLEAALAASTLTVLFGLNVGALLYAYRYAACRCLYNVNLGGLAVLPALFSVFACCGGGLMTTLLFTLGLSGFVTSILLPYGRVLAAVSASLLLANLVYIYVKLKRDIRN